MKINGIEFLIGSDPELFVKDGDKFISGHELIPGTKEAPHPVKGGAVQVDGTALEFNTMPAKSRRAFHNSTNQVVKALKNMIPRELELVAAPTAQFTKQYMKELPEKAKELGCSPDFNAYTGFENVPPNAEVDFRTGAGHIHIGWTDVENPYDPLHMLECRTLVHAMDIFLGVPSLLIDTDTQRRRIYGAAGAFRPKTYGVEYRVLSNFWVLDARLRGWVFDNTILAITRALDRDDPLPKSRHPAMAVINYNELYNIRSLLAQFNIPLPRGHIKQAEKLMARDEIDYLGEPLEIWR